MKFSSFYEFKKDGSIVDRMDAILNFSKIICKLEIANVNAFKFIFKV